VKSEFALVIAPGGLSELSLFHPLSDRGGWTILDVTSDQEDNKVLECALEGRAQYIFTGNIRHFPKHYQGISVVRPREFITVLAADLE
jgi:predicted nucleic acid-binding protein